MRVVTCLFKQETEILLQFLSIYVNTIFLFYFFLYFVSQVRIFNRQNFASFSWLNNF